MSKWKENNKSGKNECIREKDTIHQAAMFTAPTVGRKKGGLEGRKPLYFSLTRAFFNPGFSGPGVLLTPLASEGVWVVLRSTPGAA